jgi:hypothetical protein
VASAVALILRNHIKPSVEYRFPVPAYVSKACQELLDEFKSPVDVSFAGDSECPPEMEENLEDEECAEHTNDGDDDDSENVNGFEQTPSDMEERGPYGGTETRKVPFFCPRIQPKLRNLLVALFTQVPGQDVNGPFFSPLLRYLVLSSIRKNGEWTSSSSITQRIAAVLFTGRLTLYSLMEENFLQHRTYHS